MMKAIPFLLVVLAVHLTAQSNQGEQIYFHVTSVEQADATDWCTTGKCSATRFKVGGYRAEGDASIEYALECVEVIANEPTPHITMQCVHLHAHGDCSAKLYADAISFDTEPSNSSGSDKPTLSAYTIKSEKEVRRK